MGSVLDNVQSGIPPTPTSEFPAALNRAHDRWRRQEFHFLFTSPPFRQSRGGLSHSGRAGADAGPALRPGVRANPVTGFPISKAGHPAHTRVRLGSLEFGAREIGRGGRAVEG